LRAGALIVDVQLMAYKGSACNDTFVRDHDTMTRLVGRKCKVCEWHGDVMERSNQTFYCPWCHAPTALRRRARASRSVRGKNPHAAALGRLGGLKGGPARAAALSARQRRAIAAKAAKARWTKVKKSKV
jgi:hypothetical protein